MRRSDCEVTDLAKIESVIRASEIIRIGYYDNGEIYIVPVNFGYAKENGCYTFYFHGASAGRKYELTKNGCSVGFELETSAKIVVDDEIACHSTCLFQSVIGNGKLSLLTTPSEKERALNIILNRFTGKSVHTFEEKYINGVAVYQLKVEKLSCKEKTLK